jgi:hypothetical protein
MCGGEGCASQYTKQKVFIGGTKPFFLQVIIQSYSKRKELLSILEVYKRKHLTKKRKRNKKTIITNQQRGHISHSLKIQHMVKRG